VSTTEPDRAPAETVSKLSICCTVCQRPELAARAVSLLREAADEIVVAVDSRLDPADLGPLLDVSDSLWRIEYEPPTDAVLPWLTAVCRSRDILVWRGDEVPSRALLKALPTLTADPDIVQSRLARRWIFPDERFWLAERPWWPDFRVRHARRGPDPLVIDAHLHGGIRPRAPARYVEEPIYHLACVIQPFAARRRLAHRYNALNALPARGGGGLNDVILAPEHFATRLPVEVPEEDAAVLRNVLQAARPSPRRGLSGLPIVSARTITAHHGRDRRRERVRLKIAELDLRADPGRATMMLIEVTNCGDTTLRAAPDVASAGLVLRTLVLDHRPGVPDVRPAFTPLICDIPPRESRLVEVWIHVPSDKGVYTVEVDPIDELARILDGGCRFDLAAASRWGRYTL
jgi:hypothetical protein